MGGESNNLLSLLDDYIRQSTEDVALKIAEDFRNRRIEKNITREEISELSGVALANIARFEQKGLISLKNLIEIARALGYLSELKKVFSEPKFSTMDELLQIRKNTGKKKAYPNRKNKTE